MKKSGQYSHKLKQLEKWMDWLETPNDDFGGYQDIFSPKKKESDNFLKNFISRGLQKPDEDSTASKIAEGIYRAIIRFKNSREKLLAEE